MNCHICYTKLGFYPKYPSILCKKATDHIVRYYSSFRQLQVFVYWPEDSREENKAAGVP